MSRTEINPWLHRFAVLTALATLGLIGMGGLVTSHGVGMAVPDWPTSFGYNMFALPWEKWKLGGVFYEHSHRLWASEVGLLTLVLSLWLFGKKSRPAARWIGLALLAAGLAGLGRPNGWQSGIHVGVHGLALFGASFAWPRCEASPKWLRWLGVIAFVAVVFQGVLGGLRVVWFKDEIGIFHATLAQLFFTLICAIALFTSRWWTLAGATQDAARPAISGIRPLVLATTVLIFLQLMVAATMRHQHAGLAIRDFPLAYGSWWPDTSAQAVETYNARRMEMAGENPITAFQIVLQMAHRVVAVLILAGVAACAWRERNGGLHLRRVAWLWLGLIGAQIALGAWTIWSNKAADVATAHVLVGAASLVAGTFLALMSWRTEREAHGAAGFRCRVKSDQGGHRAAKIAQERVPV